MSFTGFPVAALDFYDDLEVDNTKSFWEAHKAVYKESVEAPMKALCAELEPEFGAAKVFRPYRDVRFAKDKTPYKTHQGAFVGAGPSTGWYVEISPRGTRVGAGFYEASGPRLAAIREAMADDRTGRALDRLLSGSRRTAGRSAARSSRPRRADSTRTTRGSTCCGASRSSSAGPTASRPTPSAPASSTGCGPTGVRCARSSPG